MRRAARQGTTRQALPAQVTKLEIGSLVLVILHTPGDYFALTALFLIGQVHRIYKASSVGRVSSWQATCCAEMS